MNSAKESIVKSALWERSFSSEAGAYLSERNLAWELTVTSAAYDFSEEKSRCLRL